jgi:hypothetical protein
MERFPSGQREQTVNLPAKPSEVQILPSPPLENSCGVLERKAVFKKMQGPIFREILMW